LLGFGNVEYISDHREASWTRGQSTLSRADETAEEMNFIYEQAKAGEHEYWEHFALKMRHIPPICSHRRGRLRTELADP
jgi:hypothetical protein